MKKTYAAPTAATMELTADETLLQTSQASVRIDNDTSRKTDAEASLTSRKFWDCSNWTAEE